MNWQQWIVCGLFLALLFAYMMSWILPKKECPFCYGSGEYPKGVECCVCGGEGRI